MQKHSKRILVGVLLLAIGLGVGRSFYAPLDAVLIRLTPHIDLSAVDALFGTRPPDETDVDVDVPAEPSDNVRVASAEALALKIEPAGVGSSRAAIQVLTDSGSGVQAGESKASFDVRGVEPHKLSPAPSPALEPVALSIVEQPDLSQGEAQSFAAQERRQALTQPPAPSTAPLEFHAPSRSKPVQTTGPVETLPPPSVPGPLPGSILGYLPSQPTEAPRVVSEPSPFAGKWSGDFEGVVYGQSLSGALNLEVSPAGQLYGFVQVANNRALSGRVTGVLSADGRFVVVPPWGTPIASGMPGKPFVSGVFEASRASGTWRVGQDRTGSWQLSKQ